MRRLSLILKLNLICLKFKDYPHGDNIEDNIANYKSHPSIKYHADNIGDNISKYKSHLRIVEIKESVNNDIKFTFADVSSREFQDEILKLNSKMAC